MEKRSISDTFEILVVLAIVGLVAVTGQVLIYFQTQQGAAATVAGDGSGSQLSGFVVAQEAQGAQKELTDISVERIEVNPPAPLIGDPFRVTVVLKNKGNVEIKTPFYVELAFEPRGDGVENYQPLKITQVVPQVLAPGEETSISSLVTTIVPEGPVRITATADASAKLDDYNLANNQLSKTIIVAVE